MKQVILLKYGEFFLKGLNRKTFENYLIKDIKLKLENVCKYQISKEQSTIIIIVDSSYIINKIFDLISQSIFGISYICKAFICEKNMQSIIDSTMHCFKKINYENKTFKINTKRADKKFILNSLDISKQIGDIILKKYDIKVDIINPDIIFNIEIRQKKVFLYFNNCKNKGLGGLPLNSSGQAISMISGGIDSPVASYLMMKRGLQLSYIHFYSYPYTSEQSKSKVEDLCKRLVFYNNNASLYIINFNIIQSKIKKYCSEKLMTILMRRSMLRITENLAKKLNISAIITGDSLGQVASQTINSINIINNNITIPIFRPLIGMDKIEIINISQKIETYPISILPYDDCCTIFTSKHPKLNNNFNEIYNEENKLNISLLESEALNNIDIQSINSDN